MNLMRAFGLFCSALFLLPVGAQSVQNGLSMDGMDDKVEVPNVAPLISMNTGYSMTCWVRPAQTWQGSLNWDGLCGFSTRITDPPADFCLLRMFSTTFRGSLRTSSGTYNVSVGGAVANQWQHLALVYDGDTLTLYVNGTVPANGSIPATGWLPTTAGPFRIGETLYSSSTSFNLEGDVDEVSMWNVPLTAQQVQCIYTAGINTGDTGLQLYYPMDQGVAGGNNSGMTTLVDAMGNANGTIIGMPLTGTIGNFVAGTSVSGGTQSAQMCPGGSYTFNGQVLTQAGTYTSTFSTSGGCDSLVTLVLSEINVNTGVVNSGGTLTSQAVGALYQWLDCGAGNTPIPGATGPSYTPTAAGSYAVEVTQNGCTDTSACYSDVGIDEPLALAGATVTFDGATDRIIIGGVARPAEVSASLLDASGRLVRTVKLNGERTVLDAEGLPAGMCMVVLAGPEGRRTVRVALVR